MFKASKIKVLVASLILAAVSAIWIYVGSQQKTDETVYCQNVYVALDQDPNSPSHVCSRSPIEFK
jgi:hypothetical protein